MKKYKWYTHKVIQETKDAVTIIFNTGQTPVLYQAGQYLNITCSIEGVLICRSYSFSSAPSDAFPSITVKRVTNGKMSNYLVDNATHIREWDIEAPVGNFVMKQQFAEEVQMIFLAGGSGISPLFSLLKSMRDSAPVPLLLYSGKTPEDTLFINELEKMAAQNRLNVFYSFSGDTQGSKAIKYISGRFSQPIIQTVIRQYIPHEAKAHYFICGPEELMQLHQETLRAMHIPATQIHSEYFDPVLVDRTLLESDGQLKEVLVNYFDINYEDDEPQTYECTCLIAVPAGQSLLEAMRANHIPVASSCEKGTCGLCWATKENGHVKMMNNYALTDEAIAEGKILLCQSFPLDQSVSITVE